MPAAGSVPEIPLPDRPRRVRRQRLLCLGFLPLLAAPLVLVSGPFAPVDRAAPVALRSVTGASSHTTTTGAPAPSSAAPAALRRPATTTTTAPVPASTTPPVVPEAKAAPVPTTAAPTTAPAAAAPPPTTAAPTTTTAPPPPPPPTTTTTTTAPPRAPANRQSGQATWYRWKRGNCAHNTLPKGTRVTVTAVASGRSTTCVVGDRGAFRSPTIIDLDASVFEQIAPLGAGRINVAISW